MQHNFDKYFDTSSEYWQKVQKIYDENDQFPKVVVKNRNLHHKFMRSFSRLEGIEIDNDKDNLVSLSEGDHFLVHYYLWKCTKQGFRRQTGLPVRFMYKKAAKYLTDEIAELIAKEWVCKGCYHSEETKEKIGKTQLGKKHPHKGVKCSEETKQKQHESHLGKEPWNKGKPSSEELKRKISEGNRGKSRSEETKEKIRKSKSGKNNPMYGRHWKLVNGKRVYY